jgi:MoxR-like ATPase
MRTAIRTAPASDPVITWASLMRDVLGRPGEIAKSPSALEALLADVDVHGELRSRLAATPRGLEPGEEPPAASRTHRRLGNRLGATWLPTFRPA